MLKGDGRMTGARMERGNDAKQTKRQSLRLALHALTRRGAPDGLIITVMILLLLSGLLVLFSATYYSAVRSGDALSHVKKQLIGVALGAAACAALSRLDYHVFLRPHVVITMLGAACVMLILVLIPGIGVTINGSRRWLSVAGMSFQPSEFAKFSVVIYLASVLCYQGAKLRSFFRGIVPLLIVPGLFFLLILEQPNLSTGGSIVIVAIILIFMAGARYRHLGLLTVLGGIVGALYAWSAPYRRERLLSFRDPFAKMSDEGYQLSQSIIAFGSGGLFGQGLGQGRQKFSYLPYPESDFIFAIVGEDFGLVGCVFVVALFVVLIFAGIRTALHARYRFGALLAAGITAMIGLQAFLNMGVVTGILPTTGLPLPFFSAGGTSISIIMAALGIVLSISRTKEGL